MAKNEKLVGSGWDVLLMFLHMGYLIVLSIVQLFLPSSWKPKKDIKGEIVLVTGGSGGLGRLIALRLAKLEAIVVLWDVNVKGLEETVNLVRGIGGKAYAFKCDLSDREDVYRVAKQVQQEVGDVNILINNAGMVSGNLLLNTPDHLIQRTFEVNSIAHFWTAKAFLPRMIEKKKGHIVNIASMAGFVAVAKLVDYSASKFAVIGFTKGLKSELEAEGYDEFIHLTTICPYFMEQTGMFGDVKDSFTAPRLKPNEVADRTIMALLREEFIVTVPSSLNYTLFMNQILPWSATSYMMRKTVPDAAPQSQSKPATKPKEVGGDKTNGKLSGSVSEITHRIQTTGKDL